MARSNHVLRGAESPRGKQVLLNVEWCSPLCRRRPLCRNIGPLSRGKAEAMAGPRELRTSFFHRVARTMALVQKGTASIPGELNSIQVRRMHSVAG